jgi:hypothetical protein
MAELLGSEIPLPVDVLEDLASHATRRSDVWLLGQLVRNPAVPRERAAALSKISDVPESDPEHLPSFYYRRADVPAEDVLAWLAAASPEARWRYASDADMAPQVRDALLADSDLEIAAAASRDATVSPEVRDRILDAMVVVNNPDAITAILSLACFCGADALARVSRVVEDRRLVGFIPALRQVEPGPGAEELAAIVGRVLTQATAQDYGSLREAAEALAPVLSEHGRAVLWKAWIDSGGSGYALAGLVEYLGVPATAQLATLKLWQVRDTSGPLFRAAIEYLAPGGPRVWQLLYEGDYTLADALIVAEGVMTEPVHSESGHVAGAMAGSR